WPWLGAMGVWGVALGTTYILWLYYRVVLGDVGPGLRGLRLELNAREVATLAPLVLLVLVIGFHPESVLGILRASVTQLLGAVAGDGYSQFFDVLFAATLALAALLSVRHLDAERVRPAEFYALLLLASTGMMLAASALDLLIVYLGLELMTLCSYVMVGITREKSLSNEAAIKYSLLASFASALLLYALSLPYGVEAPTALAPIPP